jgi:riboflavin-specific deaminase-like protein
MVPFPSRPSGKNMRMYADADQILSLIDSFYKKPPPAGRPRVLLSWAQSLNGAIAAAPGRRTAISCPASLDLVYRVRALSEAVLVGSATVMADDPSLSAHGFGRDPRAAVLDTALKSPRDSRVFSREGTIVLYADDAPGRASALAARGATLARTAPAAGGIDLTEALGVLRGMGIGRLMVEGGSRVLASFLEAGLADAVLITQSPRIILGGIYAAAGSAGSFSVPLAEGAAAPVGDDLVVFSPVGP